MLDAGVTNVTRSMCSVLWIKLIEHKQLLRNSLTQTHNEFILAHDIIFQSFFIVVVVWLLSVGTGRFYFAYSERWHIFQTRWKTNVRCSNDEKENTSSSISHFVSLCPCLSSILASATTLNKVHGWNFTQKPFYFQIIYRLFESNNKTFRNSFWVSFAVSFSQSFYPHSLSIYLYLHFSWLCCSLSLCYIILCCHLQ